MRPHRLRGVTWPTLLLVAASGLLMLCTALPGHAEPAPGCAVDRLPSALPRPGSAEERLAAEAVAACLKQTSASAARSGPIGDSLRAGSVTATWVTPALGTTVTLESQTVEIADAVFQTADGCVEFRLADADLGTVKLEADSLSGKLFGLIPITLGSNGRPMLPVPLPYVRLTDVTAEGVRLTARTATLHSVSGV